MFLWIRLSFIHKTHSLSSLFSNCHVKRVNPKPDSTEHFTFRFYILETKKLQAKVLKSTYQTVSVCKLLQIVNFDGFTFLTALVLFNHNQIIWTILTRILIGLLSRAFWEHGACWRYRCSLWKQRDANAGSRKIISEPYGRIWEYFIVTEPKSFNLLSSER